MNPQIDRKTRYPETSAGGNPSCLARHLWRLILGFVTRCRWISIRCSSDYELATTLNSETGRLDRAALFRAGITETLVVARLSFLAQAFRGNDCGETSEGSGAHQ